MEQTNVIPRPPIVAVLGHVDHGKTTLLDAIRKTNLAAREVGGITQQVGAYQVATKEGKTITFIDTPGHQAFSAMRSRGAKVADIVLLVVAGDDGVKPQTRESLSHIRDAGVTFIVVITKIDLQAAQVERVLQELEKERVSLEGRGGDVVVVPVSAKTGEGIPHLLEMISLVAELDQVSGDPDARLEAVVIESEFDSKRGPLATVVVRSGKISVGDALIAAGVSGKARALFDEHGKPIREALPGQPAQVLGFESVPPVGAQVVHEGLEGVQAAQVSPQRPTIPKEKGVRVLIKADTLGRLEALIANLPPEVLVLEAGVGPPTPNDVLVSSSFGASIIVYGVKTPSDVMSLAQEENVSIHPFSLIYEALEGIEKMKKGKTTTEKAVLGRGEIIADFPYGERRKIAGVKVLEGRVTKGDQLRLVRNGEEIGMARIESMKQKDKEMSSIEKGQECGILFSTEFDFKVGDMIESTKLKIQK